MADLNSLEDFLENDRFKDWIKSPDAEGTAYWENWLEQHPSKRHIFETAVATFASLEGSSPSISDEYVQDRVARMRDGFIVSEPVRKATVPLRTHLLRWAAVLLMVAGTGWFLLDRDVLVPHEKIASHGVSDTPANRTRSYANNDGRPLLINLPDGSSVVLSSGSQLEYEEGPFSREVYLAGEGFFEVAKDSLHPFFVYTNQITTRVLGTSFLVRSFDDEPKATVSVRTGKVSVTPKEPEDDPQAAGGETLLLNPNEQGSLVVATKEMIRETFNDNDRYALPELLQQPKHKFHLTPVSDVFALLEEVYGVPIKYDAERFERCTLTAVLSDEPFLDKIRMICLAIEADFEVSDDQISITGNGCDIR